MRVKFLHLLLLLSFFFIQRLQAQVTSANLSGLVVDESSKGLPGAIIKATHVPSGSVYGGASENDGSFNLDNLRVGGPYRIEVSFIGFKTKVYDNIYLSLGETYQLNVKIAPDSSNALSGVEVVANKDYLMSNQRTGAEIEISRLELDVLPSISRSISDFTRLTPQSSGSNFEGQDSRYNNFQVNGANFNNSFGLSSGLPGGNQPFPLDAIEQIQVGISPYDVKQDNFTGANINMVTRSGTNDITGSVYTYWRNETYNGDHVGSVSLPPQSKVTDNTYGFRIGGPIVKNKLFFFISAEEERNVFPGIDPDWIAYTPGATGTNISAAPADSLQKLSNFVKSKYGYTTGPYQNYANNFTDAFYRIVARLDYNINEKNKIDFSINQFNSTNPSTPSGSIPTGASVTNGRIGAYALSFANSDYSTKNVVTSLSAEWLSKISSMVSNQLVAAYTHVDDKRSTPGSQFPFVDIDGPGIGNGSNYMSLGTELFSYNNDVKYNTTSVYNNLTINAGIHNITLGASFQYFTYADSYLPYGTTYYNYNNLSAFMSDATPTAFAYTYPYSGQNGYYDANYGLGGLYAQDKINVTKDLVVTGGLRVDLPMYLNKLAPNPYIDTLKLLNPQGDTTHYNASQWPKERLLFSPRLSFNWAPEFIKGLKIHGGTGIFSGQVPFVWFTNQPGNSGTVSNDVQVSNPNILKYISFNPNPAAVLNAMPDSLRNAIFPTKSGASVPGTIALVAPNFKMPEVWRSTLSFDYKIPVIGVVASAEFMYSQDLVSVYEFNANLPKPTENVIDNFGDNRPYWASNTIYPNVNGGAFILENSKLGDAHSSTFGLSRSIAHGFFGSVYYTRMYAEDIGPNDGSQAGSTWRNTPTTTSPNQTVISPSDFFVPNRFIGILSYRKEYLRHFGTTLSLVYDGYSGGRFSYTYNTSISNNGTNYYDLMYIPKNASDLNFLPETVNGVLFTASQQTAAFNAYMNQDKYLNSHRGQYAQRNGAAYPYYGKVDFKFLQDFFTIYKKRRNTLQFSLDIVNVGNLVNRNWGLEKTNVVPYNSPLNVVMNPSHPDEVYGFKMAAVINQQGYTVLPTSTFTNSISTGSVWNMQIGLRYIF